MRYLLGIYNRNRKFIWFAICMIIGILCLIRIINNVYQEQYSTVDVSKDNSNENVSVSNNNYYEQDYSVISGETLESSTSHALTKVLENFITYCNNGDAGNAYNMLSKDCKEVLYPTITDFKNNYLDVNFNERKTYTLQSWITYRNKFIYMVELKEDMLSTGSSSNIKKQEYITAIKDGQEYYLNIAGFIEKNNINKYNENNLVNILVESEEVFIDHLNLNVKVNNKSQKDILLDSGKKSMGTYVTDSEGLKSVSYLYEKTDLELVVPKGFTKDFNIKFTQEYKKDRTTKKVTFSDISLDYKNNELGSTTVKIEW